MSHYKDLDNQRKSVYYKRSFEDASASAGGETASTGIRKHRLHTETLPLVKGGKLNIIADDYSYAVAA